MTTCARNIVHDRFGVTAVEFGLIAVPLCLLMLVPLDLGYRAYLKTSIQGELQKTARLSSLGKYSTSEIDTLLKDGVRILAPEASTITIRRRSYREFSDIGTPDKITSDTEPLGMYNVGDCFEDYNNNKRFDIDRGSDSAGDADDSVTLSVSVQYTDFIPLSGFFQNDERVTVGSSIVVQNQPYADRRNFNPRVICTHRGLVPS